MKIKRRYVSLIILAALAYLFFLKIAYSGVPFLYVASPHSLWYDLDAAELQKITSGTVSLIVLKDWREKLRRAGLSAADLIIADDLRELKLFLRDKPDAVALVPWYCADPSLRTLRLDGVYFWAEPHEYTLRLPQFRWNGMPQFDPRQIRNITIGGTVVLSRGVGNVIDRADDVHYPWQDVAMVFQEADLAIVNLKSPLVYDYVRPSSRLQLYGQARYARGLASAGIGLVSLAGNHIGDAGTAGIADTMAILDKMQIRYTGVGRELADAYEPQIIDLGGLRVAFLAVNAVGPNRYRDTDLRGQEIIYHVASFQAEPLLEALAKTAEADLRIALCNWGEEYTAEPNKMQKDWAAWLTARGVQIVAGDQAHWVQKADFREGAVISYGLGNLIFDQTWADDTREGVIERYFVYGQRLMTVDILPVFLNNQWYTEISTERARIQKILSRMF
ncbi:putative enzyme of poly-gamma-glutamate biosynthesis [Candidatus Termititenax persephonae]|uniref:Enzyme of poly-gamma-glutamate biosynthesis n=1 Tax=Candidatus Termititenax persephonae TaxID=2218525 RepID=A0A388THD1_9BACT|nr:putative enzyme of poly-gamma-glutamate biosynthesis [Candidatus Termititenax persephonae]